MTSDREIVVSRVLDAPRELAWEAMTDPRHVVQWWGPIGFTTTIQEMDVRPGGVWTHVMHGPDGTDYPNHSVFQEVVYPERIVFAQGTSPDEPPSAFIATWTFDELDGGKTRITIRMVFPTAAQRDAVVNKYGAIDGARQTLERLSGHLPTMGLGARHIVLKRVFDAPADLVFRCWTDPDHMARWWAPATFTNPLCELDVRVGGAWRIVMRSRDDTDYRCEGTYLEVIPGRRLVFNNNAIGNDGKPVLNGLTIVTFSEKDHQTTLTVSSSAIAQADFAIAYLQGMLAGWTQSLEKLAAEVQRVR